MDGVPRSKSSAVLTDHQETPAQLRRVPRCPSVIVVGASTGGPQALTQLIAHMAPVAKKLPICVTLHMPSEMMPIIAAHVTRTCGIEACVVRELRNLVPGIVYFAPGDQHFIFHRRSIGQVDLDLKPAVPREACKPAVDVMFTSAAAAFGARALAVVLSGMGQDGLEGAQAIVKAGGSVIVQDKQTSAVWGMPGAIVKAGLAEAIMTPTGLAEEILLRASTAGRTP